LETISKLRKETDKINTTNGYEELMRVREDGEKTTIYFKEKRGKKKEFVLLVDEKDELTIISIVGDLTLKEIQGMIKKE
jgi:type IV secretory pathway VirB9-like protein